MRVLVVGGTQFMGLAAVKRLVSEGHEVTVFHRGNRCELVPRDVGHIHGDSFNLTQYRSQLADFAPNAVLHMNLWRGSDTREAVQALDGITRRFVAVSSANVYRSYSLLHRWESAGEPYHEANTETSPLRQYRIPEDEEHDEKIHVEEVALNAPGLDAVVLRLPAVHGPNDPQYRGYEYLWRMDAGRPHIVMNEVFGSWRWTRGYVDNMVDALLLALENTAAVGKIFNVGEPVAISQAEWVTAIGEAVGWKGKVISTPEAPVSKKEDYSHDLTMDSTAIRNELGYRESVETADWIRRTVEWLRAHPPEPEQAEAIRARSLSFDEEDRIVAKADG